MRKFLVGSSIAFAMLFGVLASAAASTNFAGTWLLDKSKSKDMPSRMADNIESYTLTVTQDDKQLTTDTKIARKEDASSAPASGGQASGGGQGAQGGSGGGGGRGGGGFGMGMPTATYKLDGSETTTEIGGRRPGTAKLKAEWKDGGKTLELTSVRKFAGRDGGEITSTTKEHWSLSEDGKTLTIQRSGDSPQGPQKYTLVFNKH